MKLLLDTHIFLWYVTNDSRIPERWIAQLRDPTNDLYLSVVSNWEIAIKQQLGKLPLPSESSSYIPEMREQHGILTLELDELSVGQLQNLPLIHRDPFDRMLICQALAHELTFVTVDGNVNRYSVPRLE